MDIVHSKVCTERCGIAAGHPLIEIPTKLVVFYLRINASSWPLRCYLVLSSETELVAMAVGYEILTSFDGVAILLCFGHMLIAGCEIRV